MRVAVLSDIHGNAFALDAVLADLSRGPVDRVVCLGDCVQGGPQPREVVERLRSLACPTVLGNADAWLLEGGRAGGENPSPEQEAVRQWQLTLLDAADRAFIAEFRPTIELPLFGDAILLGFHGSPASYNDIVWPATPRDEMTRILGSHPGRTLCGGHTHIQFVRRTGVHAHEFFFNPGSVGLVCDNESRDLHCESWAEYALLTAEGGALSLEFRRVPFDLERWLAILRDSGRPHLERALEAYQPRVAS
ncbi:MAG: metallophosphoesterase family protein [Candidatus Eisenbacteria bacterium]